MVWRRLATSSCPGYFSSPSSCRGLPFGAFSPTTSYCRTSRVANMPSQSSLYVALYQIGLGRYHWALVVTPYNGPVNNGPLFQITNQDISQPRSIGAWRKSHKMSTDLLKSSSFVGCVRLPDCTISAQHMTAWIAEQDPQQGDTQLPVGQEWSCSQWVIRVLQRLMETGIYRVDLRHFRAKILIHANNLSQMHNRNANQLHTVVYA